MSSLMLAVFCGVAHAAEPSDDEAKEIEAGLSLREKGDDRGALERFRNAYEHSHAPRALAQIALAEQALGEWVDAESHLKVALDEKGDAWIGAHKGPLEAALELIRAHLGSLEVLADVVGAEVRVNGRLVGTVPLKEPIRAVSGSLVFEVTAEGHWPASRSVLVQPRGLAREMINLAVRPEPNAPPKEELTAKAPGPASAPAAEALPRATLTKPVDSSGGPDLMYSYALGGGAALAVGTGVVALLISNGHYTKYNDNAVCLAGGNTRIANCGGDKSAGDSARMISSIGFIGGGALAIGSGVAYLLHALNAAPEVTPVLASLGQGPGDIGLACKAAF